MYLHIVGSADQLNLAVKHEINKFDQFSQDDELVKFACASYDDGRDVASWARSNAQDFGMIWMSPIYVSNEEDLLCFIIRLKGSMILPHEIESEMSFLLPLPAQVKLEPDVLELIDALSQDPLNAQSVLKSFFSVDEDGDTEIDLTISYFTNSTTIYATEYQDDDCCEDENEKRSQVSVSNLRSYSLSSLRNYYWTESSSSEKKNNSVSHNVDLWGEFSDVLDVQSSSTEGDDDPCHFDHLKIVNGDGDIALALNTFVSSSDFHEVGACLAFLVSEYASDNMVSHISLTSRPSLLNFRARSIQQVLTMILTTD